jgi:hypothetical protein
MTNPPPGPNSVFSDKVEKRASGIDGTGLFAREAIAKGEVVVAKGGHLFDGATRDRISAELGPAEIQVAENLFLGPVTAAEREASMMHLNHSCEPNVGILGQILFVAMRDISVGEELVMDYAMMDDDDYRMPCACGTVRCRGTVTGQDWRRPELQARYAGYFSAYLAAKIAAGIQ